MTTQKKHSKKTARQPTLAEQGEVQYAFLSPAFLQYERGPIWYLVAGVFSLGVVAFGILSHSLTLVIAYLLIIAVYFLVHQQKAGLIEVAITHHGIRYGTEFFTYTSIKQFWIVHEPPYVASLKLHINRRLYPIITIHIFHENPQHLRGLLKQYLRELPDQSESFTDFIVSLLRL